MLRRITLWVFLGLACTVAVYCVAGCDPAADQGVPAQVAQAPRASGKHTVAAVNDPAWAQRRGVAKTPIVIPGGLLTVIEKVDVPSQREGVLEFIGTEIQPGEKVPEDQQIIYEIGEEKKVYRRLRVGDQVKVGQLLAQLDNRLARDELAIKTAKITASEADLVAAEKTRDEAHERYRTQTDLRKRGATSEEEWRGSRLAWDKYQSESVSKKEGVKVAQAEQQQAQTTLRMYEIRSKINGEVKSIQRQPGEAVRALDAIIQVYNHDKLRIEAQVDLQYLRDLHRGMQVVVEPTYRRDPEQIFGGHLQEVNAVAVSKDKDRPLIVSASEDGTVRVWERSAFVERAIFPHPRAVKAVACTPPGAEGNWCLSGAADGRARLWDLNNGGSDQQPRELKGLHRGAVTSVAFSVDGRLCATGGDNSDRTIHVYDTATGEPRYPPIEKAHLAAVTSLQFTPEGQLVSSGGSTTRLWTLNGDRAPRVQTVVDRRAQSKASTDLGVSPDGKWVMSDYGSEVRMMSIPEGRIGGILQNPALGTSSFGFETLALFSPDGRLALTAGLGDGRLQLWRLPTDTSRAYEAQQLVPGPDKSKPTCGAFAPHGGFFVTGNKERKVFVWTMPTKQEIDEKITAKIVYIERSVESAERQVRVWAELKNPQGRLLPGDTVTMVVYPE